MDIDDEIELIFNDYRISEEDIKQYNITNIYATSKQETTSTTLGVEAIIFYEKEDTGYIQDGEVE